MNRCMALNTIEVNFGAFTHREVTRATRTCIEYVGDAGEAVFRNEIPYQDTKVRSAVKHGCTWKSVYSVALSAKAEFCPGDAVGLLVPNSRDTVDTLFSICSLENRSVVIRREGRRGFFYKGSLYDFFVNYFDMSSLPRKSFLYALSRTAVQQEKLEYLCSKEGARDYFRILENRNTLVDILATFGCKPSTEVLIENCEIIKPRFFSLTNRVGDRMEILLGAVRGGHVSSFVERARKEDCIKWYVKQNTLMRMTQDQKALCVGAGTGIAPFYSFVRNKAENQAIWIVFGCRNVEDDLSAGIGPDDGVEVSRALTSRKESVVDVLKRDVEKVKAFLENGCAFVCGPTRMQREVFSFFKDLLGPRMGGCVFFDDWR